MRTRIHFVVTILATILSFGLTHRVFADAADDLEQARAYEEKGRYEQAEQLYEAIVAGQAGTDYGLEAQEKLTCLYVTWGKETEAQAGLGKLLADYSHHERIATAVTHVADTYRAKENHQRACEIYADVIAAWPGDEHAMWSQMGLTMSYASLGDDAAARSAFALLRSQYTGQEHISRAVCLVGDHYRRLQNYTKACEFYEDVLASWPDAEFALWSRMGLAISRIRLRDGAGAKAAVERLTTVFSQDERIPVALCMVGDEYRAVGQYEEACELYQRVVGGYPEAEHALWSQMNLAVSNIRLERYDAAKTAADKLLADFSEDNRLAFAARTVGDEYRGKKKLAEAFDLYESVVSNHAGTKDAMWSQMNLAISKIGLPNDVNAAVAATDKLAADFSEDSEISVALCWVGDAWRKAGNHTKAIEVYNRVLTEHPKSEYALWSQTGKGMSYVQLNDLAKAGQAGGKLRADFSGDPQIATAMCMLADEYRWTGKYDGACELYGEIVETWPSAEHAMWAQAGLAMSKILSGDDEAAQDAIKLLAGKFSGRERFNVAIQDVAWEYGKKKQYDRVRQVNEYVKGALPNSAQNDGTIWWRTAAITSKIALGDDSGIDDAVDSLISDLRGDPELAKALHQIGHKYNSRARIDALESGGSPKKEDFRKAIAVWERIIRDLPACETTPVAYFSAALCYTQELDEYVKGVAYYQAIVDGWPDCQFAGRAQFYVGMHTSRLKGLGIMEAAEADPLIEKANKGVVENYPDSESASSAALKLAKIYSDKGLFAKSADYYEFYLEREKSERDRSSARNTVYTLGRRAAMDGKMDTAARLYRLVIASANTSDNLLEKAETGLAKILKAMEVE